MNLYGYAAGDPINNSDPFGLCPPEDNDPCDMNTGDPNLDDPSRRNVMENGYKRAKLDADGYYIEEGGACAATRCWDGTKATRDQISIDFEPGTIFDWHSHRNVGRPIPGQPGDIYLSGPSERDVNSADIARNIGFRHPSYIIEQNTIFRISTNAQGNLVLDTFNRWKAP